MALPSAYLTSVKRVPEMLEAIKNAQAPERFTIKFLEDLGFTSSTDRLFINVLKALGFLTDQGQPTERYHQYLDRSQSRAVLAEGIRDAYSDLFQLNRHAENMKRADVLNKMRTLSQGQYSDDVLSKMATTFTTLSQQADFSSEPQELQTDDVVDGPEEETPPPEDMAERFQLGGLVYNIQIHLPESRDPAVYDALFRSLRQHLFR